MSDCNIFSSFDSYLIRTANAPESERKFVCDRMTVKRLSKGEFYMLPGGRADVFAWVYRGLVKRYFNSLDGKEIIVSIDCEEQLISDYSSLIQGVESQIYIEAVEDCILLTSEPGLFLAVRGRHNIWKEFARVLAELRYIFESNRVRELLSMDGKERYRRFLVQYKDVIGRISKKDIATYVGMTPSSLSRMIKNEGDI